MALYAVAAMAYGRRATYGHELGGEGVRREVAHGAVDADAAPGVGARLLCCGAQWFGGEVAPECLR